MKTCSRRVRGGVRRLSLLYMFCAPPEKYCCLLIPSPPPPTIPQVTNLCDLSSENDEVSSVCWMGKGQHLAVGTAKGLVQIWDAQACRRVRTMPGHTHRVGTLASKTFVLASGSRDRKILMRDVRVKDPYVGELMGHKQEVCGLKWSSDNQYLASGGNDNKLLVWDPSQTKAGPLIKFSEHQAAVKAIAWSPHQHGLLASGGGTADRCIRFWNTTTAQPLQCVDTGSQVCFLGHRVLLLSACALGILWRSSCTDLCFSIASYSCRGSHACCPYHFRCAIWPGPRHPTSWSARTATRSIRLSSGSTRPWCPSQH